MDAFSQFDGALKVLFFIIITVLIVLFGAGLLTGWLLWG